MPRYFFNVFDGQEAPDLQGVELFGPDEALKMARVIANELTRNAKGNRQIVINVTDEYDNPGFEVTGVG